MKNQHLRALVLAGAFCGCVVTPAYGQCPIARPEVVAGPWEFTGSSGVEGIFLSIRTHAEGTVDRPIVTSQTVNVRVYQRQDGQETWGWYSAAPSGPPDAPSVFDGQHLHIRRVRNGPTVDIMFHAEKNRWIGTWTREDQSREVVLERPRPPSSVAPNPWRGTWEGVGEGSGLTKAQARLHIDQSSDGTLTVWTDHFLRLIDQRHGELLRVVSLEQGTITFGTIAAAGREYRFQGALSPDGLRLSGGWTAVGDGTLNASESFRRLP
jgi:hypothetical protein